MLSVNIPFSFSIGIVNNVAYFQLLNMLKFYARFEISDESGDPMTDRDMTLQHYSRITSLQVRYTLTIILKREK